MTATAADFAEIAQRLHAQEDLQSTLQEVAQMSCAALDADMAGVMLVRRGKVEMAAVTDETVAKADALQLELDEGPCLEALDDQTTFIICDTSTETRWARWCRGVDDLGVRSVLSLRLSTEEGVFGALNIYAAQPDRWDREDLAVGRIYADHASIALSSARTESGLREAMDGRHLIGLAQGILMARFDLTVDQAFSVLRRYSQDRNMKLRHVAAHVVESRTLPS